MSLESDLNSFYRRTESATEIKPLSRDSAEEKLAYKSETNFLKRLFEALDQLQQRDDLQGYRFTTEREVDIGLVVIMTDQEGLAVARLKPEHCIEMAEQSSSEGLLVEIKC